MRALVVINPRARAVVGSGTADRITAGLQTRGVEPVLHISETEEGTGAAIEAAIADGIDVVVAVGGDGTVGSVANHLVGRPLALGVIPLGTANIAARRAGIAPGDIDRACEVIAAGKTRTVDVGRIDDRYFAAMGGIGIDAEVIASVERGWKRWVGRLAFIGRFLIALVTEKPGEYRMRFDGGELVAKKLWGIIVCNTPQYGWRITLVPEAVEDDGVLDVVLLNACGRVALLWTALGLFAAGRPARANPRLTVLRSRSFEVDCQPPAPWHADGDVRDLTPVTVSVVPGGLRVLTAQ
jgi:diacylglycerol kinase (ATP)